MVYLRTLKVFHDLKLWKLSAKSFQSSNVHFHHYLKFPNIPCQDSPPKYWKTLPDILGFDKRVKLEKFDAKAKLCSLFLMESIFSSTWHDFLQNFGGQHQSEQLNYRRQRSRLAALEINTETFLKICIPNDMIWERLGWRGKKVIEIVSQIVNQDLPVLRL